MSIVIHGVGGSPYVRKVRVALLEKGVDYELKPVMPMPGMMPDDYAKLHPLKKIPVLQDGDYVLPDSSCILAYLERVHPSPALYPSDPKAFGRALWYEEYSDTKVSETVGPIFFNRFVKKNIFKQEPDEEIVAQKLKDLEPVFDYLQDEIGDDEYLVENRFSVADIALGSIFANFGHAGESVDAGRFPRLAAYVERLHSRPSFKSLIEEEKALRFD
jgi:glutathione S-transferase